MYHLLESRFVRGKMALHLRRFEFSYDNSLLVQMVQQAWCHEQDQPEDSALRPEGFRGKWYSFNVRVQPWGLAFFAPVLMN